MNKWEKHTVKSVIPISFDLHRQHLAFSLEDKKKNSFTYFTAKYFLDTLHIIAIQYLILCHYLCILRGTVLMVIPHFKRQAVSLELTTLPQSPQCWDQRYVPGHSPPCIFLNFNRNIIELRKCDTFCGLL